MTVYTESNLHVIETEISAPMEFCYMKCVGESFYRWEAKNSFTPRWLSPGTTEEYIGKPWPKSVENIEKHTGRAVTARGIDEKGQMTPWKQIVIIDQGPVWDEKSQEVNKMIFQVRQENYNAFVTFEKQGPAKTKMYYSEWGTDAGLTDQDVSDRATVNKFAQEVEKDLAKTLAGKDRRPFKVTELKNGRLKTKILYKGDAAARAHQVALMNLMNPGNKK
jgi:hypothetical protein